MKSNKKIPFVKTIYGVTCHSYLRIFSSSQVYLSIGEKNIK